MKMPFKLKLKLKRREKAVLIIGGLLAVLIISYKAFQWYEDVDANNRNRLETKAVYLKKQFEKISEKENINTRIGKAKEELKELEKGLLSGDKSPVAAAELQKLLKDMAMSLNVEIKSERISAPIDAGFYLEVPVEIGFIATTSKLKDMILRIETSPMLLTITGLDIRVMNFKNPAEVYAVMTVNGFLRKPKMEKPAKEKVTNAA